MSEINDFNDLHSSYTTYCAVGPGLPQSVVFWCLKNKSYELKFTTNTMNVLIIQENASQRGVIREILAKNGPITHAKNEKQAVNAFVHAYCVGNRFDLVLAEDRDIIKRLRRVEKKLTNYACELSKMVILGPRNSYKDILDAFESGANTYMEYPRTTKDFIQGMQECNISL